MKTEKTMYRLFSYRDRKGMIQFLENQAMKGWLFSGFKNAGWRFRRIEPKKVHFSVIYFPGVSEYDAAAPSELIEFREFCAHSGWKFVASSEKIQIFRNESGNPVPIETEPLVELGNIHKIEVTKIKKDLIKSFLRFMLWLLVGFAVYRRDPVSSLLNPVILLWIGLWGVEFLLTLMRAVEYAIWYHKAKRYAYERNEFLNDRYAAPVSGFLRSLLFVVCLAIAVFYSGWKMFFVGLLVLIVCIVVLVPVFSLIKNQLYNRKKTMLMMYVCSFVAVFVIMGLFNAGIDSLDMNLAAYAPLDSAWAKYEETPPLSAEEFYGDGTEQTRYTSRVQETIFLAEYRAWIYAEKLNERVDLDYTILEVKWEALYDTCLTEYLDSESFPVDSTPWGAGHAYRYGDSEAPKLVWLLCYDNRIVQICISEEPTLEQMETIGRILGNPG